MVGQREAISRVAVRQRLVAASHQATEAQCFHDQSKYEGARVMNARPEARRSAWPYENSLEPAALPFPK